MARKASLFLFITLLILPWSTHSYGDKYKKRPARRYKAWGQSVQQTADGGYIIAGTAWGSDGKGSDVLLIRTDTDGNKLWIKTFGRSVRDRGYFVRQTKDSGYIMAGETESMGAGKSDVYLIKTDGNGGKVWDKIFGSLGFDYGYSVRQTTDGGYIIAGKTNSLDGDDDKICLIKTDPNGKEKWSRTFQ